mmetsp:Transcript_23909/g.38923  ORF Transcript_23909/g.38923 Transcript_23909/m.38923 type:complete len:154 (-) Transcript_23909:227-688(-)
MTTFNPNAENAPEMEIIAHTLPSYDTEGRDDVAELAFGNDAEEHSSSKQTRNFFNKRNTIILVATAFGTILLLFFTGFGASSAVATNNVIRSFSSATKQSKGPKSATKAPKSTKCTPNDFIPAPGGDCSNCCACEIFQECGVFSFDCGCKDEE